MLFYAEVHLSLRGSPLIHTRKLTSSSLIAQTSCGPCTRKPTCGDLMGSEERRPISRSLRHSIFLSGREEEKSWCRLSTIGEGGLLRMSHSAPRFHLKVSSNPASQTPLTIHSWIVFEHPGSGTIDPNSTRNLSQLRLRPQSLEQLDSLSHMLSEAIGVGISG